MKKQMDFLSVKCEKMQIKADYYKNITFILQVC